jgi:hypothetical protein
MVGEIEAAKVTASLAKRALSDDDTSATLQKLAEDSPTMHAAAEIYARRVALKQSLLLKLYEPLGRFIGLSHDYFKTDFHEDMAKKLADIPEGHLVSPSPQVAIPAMEGLRYAIDEPDLKDMYLNLLATATDDRSQESAHPSFPQVIKEISPAEARILLDVLRADVLPVVRLMLKSTDEGATTVATNLVEIRHKETQEQVDLPMTRTWIDNWARLGLVEVDHRHHLVADERYTWVDDCAEYKRLVDNDPRGKDSVEVEKGILRTTDFGRRFLSAVSFDGVPIDVMADDAEQGDEEPVSDG